METTQLFCHCSELSAFDIFSIVLTVLGLIISILFVIRPRLHYCAYKKTKVVHRNTSKTNKNSQQITNNEQSVKNSSVNKHADIDPYSVEILEEEDECVCNSDDSKGICRSTSPETYFNGNDYEWVVKVENKNWFCVTIREIQCEIALSKTEHFLEANTLDLRKGMTLFLKSIRINPANNYLFISKIGISEHQNRFYKYLRVRLLASNFLGVKKHYERIYCIDTDLTDVKDDCITRCQCYHTISSPMKSNCCFTNLKCTIWSCFNRKKIRNSAC